MHQAVFDNQAAAFFLLPGFAAALLAQLVNWRLNGDFPGVRWWSIGLALHVAGIAIRVNYPDEPNLMGMFAINVLVMAGQFALLYGLCRFAGRPMFVKTMVVTLVAYAAVLIYSSAVQHSIMIRTFNFAGGLAIVCGLQLSLLPRIARREGWTGAIVLAAAYGLTIAGIAARGIAMAIGGPDSIGALHVGESLGLLGRQTLVQIFVTIVATGYSYGYILMVNNRSRWQMRQMATEDALTGAPNRRAFDAEIMHAALRVRRDKTYLGLALMDLDHFKKVNDTYGHAAGDALLRHFADLVNDTLRETDFFARIGGEEFALVVADASSDSIHLAAERIRSAVESSNLVLPTCILNATVSVGSAVADLGESDVEALYRAADVALYRAKSNGRNRVERADLIPPALDAIVGARVNIAGE
ncbi:MAG TPA: GGDEF domain-containing protein [Magnetospirillaceae bacterium]|jgi:diguanylate cyclase (GGDEF)-like protein